MLVVPESRYEIVHVSKKNRKGAVPNNSNPMKVQAIGVLVAPQNTAIKPIAAVNARGRFKCIESILPSVTPIKKSGVTSPPLKPAPSVIAVKSIFNKNTCGACGIEKLSSIVGIPKPRKRLSPIVR